MLRAEERQLGGGMPCGRVDRLRTTSDTIPTAPVTVGAGAPISAAAAPSVPAAVHRPSLPRQQSNALPLTSPTRPARSAGMIRSYSLPVATQSEYDYQKQVLAKVGTYALSGGALDGMRSTDCPFTKPYSRATNPPPLSGTRTDAPPVMINVPQHACWWSHGWPSSGSGTHAMGQERDLHTAPSLQEAAQVSPLGDGMRLSYESGSDDAAPGDVSPRSGTPNKSALPGGRARSASDDERRSGSGAGRRHSRHPSGQLVPDAPGSFCTTLPPLDAAQMQAVSGARSRTSSARGFGPHSNGGSPRLSDEGQDDAEMHLQRAAEHARTLDAASASAVLPRILSCSRHCMDLGAQGSMPRSGTPSAGSCAYEASPGGAGNEATVGGNVQIHPDHFK